jgi:hypothetical protein
LTITKTRNELHGGPLMGYASGAARADAWDAVEMPMG